MNQIIPNLFLGDIVDASAANLGQHIDRAINVCVEYFPAHACPDSWHVGFADGAKIDAKVIHRAVQLIHDGLLSGKRVLIHCAGGVSRSPMVVAAYLVKSGHFPTFDKAMAHVWECRNKVDPAEPTYRSGQAYCATGFRLTENVEPTIVIP